MMLFFWFLYPEIIAHIHKTCMSLEKVTCACTHVRRAEGFVFLIWLQHQGNCSVILPIVHSLKFPSDIWPFLIPAEVKSYRGGTLQRHAVTVWCPSIWALFHIRCSVCQYHHMSTFLWSYHVEHHSQNGAFHLSIFFFMYYARVGKKKSVLLSHHCNADCLPMTSL